MAMEEDFDEAEVLWPDSAAASGGGGGGDKSQSASGRRTATRQGGNLWASSCPVKIPSPRSRVSNLNGGFVGGGDGVDADDDDDSDPPHVVVERRDAATSASMPGIAGREKGLRLCRVRNQVLRMTGFIE